MDMVIAGILFIWVFFIFPFALDYFTSWYSCKRKGPVGFKDFFELCSWFNEEDVRYQIVAELPAIDEVYDRRCVYILIDYTGEVLFCTPYIIVSGVWLQVETVDVNDFLGRVDGYE